MKSKTQIILILAIFTCGNALAQNTIDLLDYKIEVLGDLKGFNLNVENRTEESGVEIAVIKLSSSNKSIPPQFSLKWSVPSNAIHGYWSTSSGFNRTIHADWGPSTVNSKLAKNAPVMTLLSSDGQNKLTYAVSDALNTVRVSSAVREEDARIYCQVDFFTEKHKEIAEYTVELRLDARAVQYSESLNDVATWWASFDQLKPAPVPDHARLPMYSTWYSYHQNVAADELLEECKVAKSIGYESIIVDDGWQTLDSNRGYAYAGDWKPDRITEMKKFVADVHALDMKFLIWYGVPLVGEKSEVYKKFKGKFLRYWNGQGAYFLDPRYPEVREHIIDTYKTALKDWQVDGFKLDFLGTLVAYENTVLEATEGRDIASVNEAVDVLMTEVISELRQINPEIMIEFRQPYIGPLMRKYGNLFRAADCPNSIVENRVRTTDLRLLSGNTAVHADMLMWQTEEPVELAALQLLNVLYSVPQLSVRLNDIPKDHFKMVQYYNEYWTKNRSVLLDGDFDAASPLANYTKLQAQTSDLLIATLYDDQWVSIDRETPKQIDILNAKMSDKVVIEVSGELGTYQLEIKNCLGEILDQKQVELKSGMRSFKVPVSGMISLIKK